MNGNLPGPAGPGGSRRPDGAPEIAVIGLAGRWPGAQDPEHFWDNLRTGRECFGPFSDEELLASGQDPAVIHAPNYVRVRPVLDDIRGWDAAFFGSSPREALLTDPQQRIFAECAWEVLEAAGYGVAGSRGVVGVFAGVNFSAYLVTRTNALRMGAGVEALVIANDKDALSTAVAYQMDLRGPAVSVQTFCSTSLVAVHLASAAVRRGECDIAIAGGVSIRVPDRFGHLHCEGDQTSPDGHVRAFDAKARGTLYGDGAAVVALKRLDRALADRDTVLATIRGSAINNDGALKFGFQAPSIDGQRRCVAAAIADAGVEPTEISYVEAHGAATEVGDPMEVAALTDAYGSTPAKQYCLLGSVKPNVGHLDRASGATGLIKVVQSLRHGLIPGTLNFQTPNPEIAFADSPFRVTAEPTPWPRRADRPRIAGLTSLGTGGTNAHAIVQEAPEPLPRAERPRRWQVLPLSARSASAVESACANLAARMARDPGLDVGDVAFTLQTGRKLFQHRRFVVADCTTGAVTALTQAGMRLGREDATIGRRVGFLLAGVGEQYPGMAAALYRDEPGFRQDVDECLSVLGLTDATGLSDLFDPAFLDPAPPAARAVSARLPGFGPTEASQPTPTADPHLVQPAVFVAEYALARQLIRWGLTPGIMVGYSLGEYVAACLSGVLTLTDALRLVAVRAKLISSLPAGAMLAVGAHEGRLRSLLGPDLGGLDIAVRTGSQIVLAGRVEAAEDAARTVVKAGIGCRRLQTSHAYHARALAPIRAELTAWAADNVTVHPPAIPYVSNVTGELATEDLVADPAYWARHLCQTVEFGRGLEHALQGGDTALVEIGPGRSLGVLARAHGQCTPAQWPLIIATVPASSERCAAHTMLAEAVGRLWLTGATVDWAALHAGWKPGRVPLPTYPFERRDYWPQTPPGHPTGPSTDASSTARIDHSDPAAVLTGLPMLPESRWINVPTWRQTALRPARKDCGTWLAFTDLGPADEITAALQAEVGAVGGTVFVVRPGDRYSAADGGFTLRAGSPQDASALLRELAARGSTPDHVLHLWSLSERSAATARQATDAALTRGLHTLVALAGAAGDLSLSGWTLDIVTAGSQKVLPGDRIRPESAALLGPVRLVPVEYPGTRTRLVDLADPGERGLGDAAVLLRELLGEPHDQVVAVRGGRRWLPGYDVLDSLCVPDAAAPAPSAVSAPPAAHKTAAFKTGGVYLVTGGLGRVGLAMAERMAVDHKARLVLFGRTPVPAADQWPSILAATCTAPEVRRRMEGLTRLRSAGTEFLTLSGDVSDSADVRGAVAAALKRFGVLDGVVHCAGVPAAGMMQFKTAADMEKVLAPKVGGALALAEALREVPVDFLVLFSSTASATGGGAGHVDYAAASAYLDAFALSDPLHGTFVTSIDWCEFAERRRQPEGIPIDAGWAVMRKILAAGEPHVVVCTRDFAPIVAMSRAATIESRQEAVGNALGRRPRPDLSTAYIGPGTPAEEAIAEVWAEALGLDRVGVHDDFFDLGGDSLIGMGIITRVRKALGASCLPPRLLYQATTVSALAAAAAAGLEQAEEERSAGTGDPHRSRIEQRRSRLRHGRA